MTDRNDPGAPPEQEGIPDLQDGSPHAERASDPQRMAVPGEAPVAADKYGTTHAEQVEGESLNDKLAEKESDVNETSRAAGPPTEEAGLLSDDPLEERPANQDVFSQESAAQALTVEESAVRVVDDDRDIGRLRGMEDEADEGYPDRPEPLGSRRRQDEAGKGNGKGGRGR